MRDIGATDVFLNWKHDADDQLVVRISPKGWVTGNRLGRTSITAGAGDPTAAGVWARVRVEVQVMPNPDQTERGFHAQKVVDMVIQVHMKDEFDAKGDAERPDLWTRHKAVFEIFQVMLTQAMWGKLQTYVLTGGGLD